MLLIDPLTLPIVNDPTGDLTFRSSDDVVFKVHRKNLAAHSAAFAAAGETTHPEKANEEEIRLQDPETAAVLDLLFQYMYPQPQPDLQHVNFRVFVALAETVEKYEVYSALPAVRTRMRCVPLSPIQSLFRLILLSTPLQRVYSDPSNGRVAIC